MRHVALSRDFKVELSTDAVSPPATSRLWREHSQAVPVELLLECRVADQALQMNAVQIDHGKTVRIGASRLVDVARMSGNVCLGPAPRDFGHGFLLA
jgi:hypothetical protein